MIDLVLKTTQWSRDGPAEGGAKKKNEHYEIYYTLGNSMDFVGVSVDTYLRQSKSLYALLKSVSSKAAGGDNALHAQELSRAKNYIAVQTTKATSQAASLTARSGVKAMIECPDCPLVRREWVPLPERDRRYTPLSSAPDVQWDGPLRTAVYFVSSREAPAPTDEIRGLVEGVEELINPVEAEFAGAT
jgi:hypothetical protein